VLAPEQRVDIVRRRTDVARHPGKSRAASRPGETGVIIITAKPESLNQLVDLPLWYVNERTHTEETPPTSDPERRTPVFRHNIIKENVGNN